MKIALDQQHNKEEHWNQNTKQSRWYDETECRKVALLNKSWVCLLMINHNNEIIKRCRYRSSFGVHIIAEFYEDKDEVVVWRDEFNLPFHYSKQAFGHMIKMKCLTLGEDGDIMEFCWKKLETEELKEQDIESLK